VILTGTTKGAWMPEILRLLRQLRPAVSPDLQVIVLADRGLWSPRLFKRITDLGWHPLLRLTGAATFAPQGQKRQRARELVPGPGHAWVGRGTAFKDQRRRVGTLIMVWVDGQADPWLLLTDLRPRTVGIAWYSLRMWIELGFKALKGMAWHWDQTRRTDPARVARHWLVLSVATILTLATATRIEDAALLDLPPAVLHAPPKQPPWRPPGVTRTVSLIRQGLSELRRQLIRGRLWTRY
jgi:Transposase DDE domain